ncbi:MAG: class I SAM-dependent methyltransferase [Zoogloeaceae bacterium]|jgi:SAM-dependent methyltransferase|nr:class I SAM-dependent methyltransferase [Zoogloeaceae bacterium]
MNPFPVCTLAFKYCAGQGMELGASSHNPFNLPACLNVAPCDGVDFLHPLDQEDYKKSSATQENITHKTARVDRIGDFQNLPADDASLDYLISSHVIEHEPNPVAAFIESFRVLKENGVFFCIFPKRTAEKGTDIFRPITRQEELIAAYEENRTVLDGLPPSGGWRGHYHVYTLQSMLRLVNWINRQGRACFRVETLEETDSKVGNGHTLVLRKMPPYAMPDNDYSLLLESCIRKAQYEEGLQAARNSLSFDFFQTPVLYAAALLLLQVGDMDEAKEFYRQCLLQEPECETRRREFFELFGEYYVNPLR